MGLFALFITPKMWLCAQELNPEPVAQWLWLSYCATMASSKATVTTEPTAKYQVSSRPNFIDTHEKNRLDACFIRHIKLRSN